MILKQNISKSVVSPFFRKIYLLLLLFVGGSVAHADHAAVAYISAEKWGAWVAMRQQKDAESKALEYCRNSAPEAKCFIKYSAAISLAESPTVAGIYSSDIGKADANKRALKLCGKRDCKISWTRSTPGFYTIYKAIENGDISDFHLEDGLATGQEAIDLGKRNCERRYKLNCVLMHFGAVKGAFNVAKPEAANKPQATAPTPSASCRPNTAHIRCSTQCFNGNCTVMYENGCKMRVQVQPKYDPFSNQWTYPSPSC